jgi:hypothetical protein
MNIVTILISSQLGHFNPTYLVVHRKCTLKVSILIHTLLLHLSILKTLLCHVVETLVHHHSINTITHFCHKSYPKANILSATITSEEDINMKVLLEYFVYFYKSVSVKVVFK